MDKTMSKRTRIEVLQKLRRRYETAGAEHKRKLLDQAQELLGYHRKAAIRALRQPAVERGPRIITGRPVEYEPSLLERWLRPIWRATGFIQRDPVRRLLSCFLAETIQKRIVVAIDGPAGAGKSTIA